MPEIEMIEFQILEPIRINKFICQKCGTKAELENLITANMREGDLIGICGICGTGVIFEGLKTKQEEN